jgi:hypothetical protein
MTNHVARLYALVLGVVVFFVIWATVAAHPWPPKTAAAADPRVAALAARQHQIRIESIRVQKIVAARWAVYRRALATHNAAVSRAQLAAAQSAPVTAPAVRVVTLPPLVVTRVS